MTNDDREIPYMSRVLPETALRLARIETGAEPVMDLPAEAF